MAYFVSDWAHGFPPLGDYGLSTFDREFIEHPKPSSVLIMSALDCTLHADGPEELWVRR